MSGVPGLASVVIPAYNEERNIAAVLEVLRSVEELERIVVVDDGSQDDTSGVVRRYRAQDPRILLVRLPVNLGKGGAVKAGAECCPNDLILFLDADLVGLRPENVMDLIEPVASRRFHMTMGVFSGGRFSTDFTQHITPFLNGQRCLLWSLFRDTPELADSRGGVDMALSLHARSRGYRVRRVPLRGVTHVMKHEKQPYLAGRRAHALMFGEIFRYLFRHLDHR